MKDWKYFKTIMSDFFVKLFFVTATLIIVIGGTGVAVYAATLIIGGE